MIMLQNRYLKRFRMELDLRRASVPRAKLPEGFRWVGWHPVTLDRHAAVKFSSFRQQADCEIFPALATLQGCQELMRGIMTHRGFLPRATWLIEFTGNEFCSDPACGTIQGLVQSTTTGSIQNVAVVPDHRGEGLGRALLLKSLAGFRNFGLERVFLEVTADNHHAIELYRSVGFRRVKTTYRPLRDEATIV